MGECPAGAGHLQALRAGCADWQQIRSYAKLSALFCDFGAMV